MTHLWDDTERFPLLNDAGKAMLRRLLEHPHGPRYNHQGGERLTAVALDRVRDYAAALRTDRKGWRAGEFPAWVAAFVEQCARDVPFYRRRGDASRAFLDLPALTRADLRAEPWAFVPDGADLRELIVYTTSGTSGDRLTYPAHPELPNRYLPLIQEALAAHGVRIEGGPRVSIIQVGFQERTVTMPSVMSYLDFAGFAKINLNPSEWRDPDDRVRFLDDCAAEVYTGDPIAFAELAGLPTAHRPKALVSAATRLLPGLKARLAERFGCPVVDIYSMNESGPVSFAVGDGHEVLPHNLFVEILDDEGRPCEPGVRGEITLTGGANPYLPLVRYRTGDFAALDFLHPVPRLVGFEGRIPVVFVARSGRRFNSIDVSTVLRDLPLPFLVLHQRGGGSLLFRTSAADDALDAAVEKLRGLFGADQPLTVENLPRGVPWAGKPIQYHSDLPGPCRE